jgi:type VI secretion system ImpJ/VasE family protein
MLYRPLWTEGTLLCPQHMQQQDHYHEQHLAARLGAIAPHPWGVLALRFDAAALQAGQLALSHLRAVLPDGTAVDLDDDSPQRPPARAIAPHFPAHAERLTVHLVAPSMRPGVANVAAEPGARYRYRSVTRAIFDLTLGRSSRDIELGELNLALRLGDESQTDHVALPIAELLRDPGGAFILDDTFIPPIVALTGCAHPCAPSSTTLCAQVARPAAAPSPKIVAANKSFGSCPAVFTPSAAPSRSLRHLVGRPRVRPPLDLYRELLRLLGELRSFTTDGSDHDRAHRDHRASADNFRDQRSLRPRCCTSSATTSSTPSPTAACAIAARGLAPTACGSASCHDDRLQRGSTFVLAVESDADPPPRSPTNCPPSPASPPGGGSTLIVRQQHPRRTDPPHRCTHPSSSPSSRTTATSSSPSTTPAGSRSCASATSQSSCPVPTTPNAPASRILAIPSADSHVFPQPRPAA